MTNSAEKLTVFEKARDGMVTEKIFQLLTGHSVAELTTMDLASKYYDRGRGKLSPSGKEHTKKVFSQIFDMYATEYDVDEILSFLREVYTYAIIESGQMDENRTFQLLISSLRGLVLFHKQEFKNTSRQEAITVEKVRLIPPRIRKWLRSALLGVSLALTGEVTGINPYLVEVGKAVLGAEYQAADLDQELRDQITGGDSHKAAATPSWLDQDFEQYPVVNSVIIPTETPTETPTIIPTTAHRTYTSISTEPSTVTTTPSPTHTLEPTQQPSTQLPPTQEAVELSPEVDTILEFMLGGELYQAVVEAREIRLGLRTLESIPSGYKEVTHNGVTFTVPEDLPAYMNYVYSPVTYAQSLGAYQLPAEERQAFLESKINDGMIHFAISGLDYRPEYSGANNGFIGRTDAPMIVSINIQTGEIVLTSIARDIWSPEVAFLFGGSEASQKVAVMSWLHGDPIRQTDPGFSRMVYENICGCAIDGVIQMNFDATAELIDELFPDGIEIEVTQSIHDENFPGGSFHIESGTHFLDGTTAVKYARSRYDSPEGDISRQDRQRQVIMAMIKGVVSEFKDELLAGRPRAALDIFDQFLRITSAELTTYEQNRIALDDGDRPAAQESYLRSIGLTPAILLAHFTSVGEQLSTPEGIGVLTAIATDPDGRQQLLDFRSGSNFTTIQIIPTDTDRNASTNVGYWTPARQKITSAHQGQP